MLSKILTAKVAAAATVAAFGLGTAAAAATGSLPGQTTHANPHAATGLANAEANIGAHGHGTSNPSSSSGGATSGSIPVSGPANSHAQYGLCTAFLAAGAAQTTTSVGSSPSTPPQYNSTAFQALLAQNHGVAATTTYCQGVVANHPPTSDATDTSNPADAGKPAHTGDSVDTGGRAGNAKPLHTVTSSPTGVSSQGRAPVSTPNSGGTGTASAASGGASSAGSATAGAASHDASSAGSANSSAHR